VLNLRLLSASYFPPRPRSQVSTMGPPAEFAPIGQPALTQGSVSVKLPNGPQAFEIGKALKVAVEGDSGYALPVLPADADKEILGLINAYLSSRGLALKVEKKGEKWAEEEQLLELVLTGKWAELVGALKVLQVHFVVPCFNSDCHGFQDARMFVLRTRPLLVGGFALPWAVFPMSTLGFRPLLVEKNLSLQTDCMRRLRMRF
jgi:hypothetical protein